MTTDAYIGERIHQRMWTRRLTQRSLAAQLGLQESTVGRKLRGERKWTVDEVLTVAQILDVPITTLLPEVTSTFPPESDDAEAAIVIPFRPRAAMAVAS